MFRSSYRPLSCLNRLFATGGDKPSKLKTESFRPNKLPLLSNEAMKGKTAFVTGGGTGIGKGIATGLAKAGANVTIIGRKQDVLEKATQEIKDLSKNDNIHFHSCDVRDIEGIKAAFDSTELVFKSVPDLIVNNAAGNFISPTLKLSPNAFGSVIDIVLKGTINVSMEAAKRLVAAQKGASFLSISTLYANTGSAFVVPSAVAKAGVEVLTKSLAAEWGRYGFRFNAIAPGPIYTEGAFSRLDPTGRFQKVLTKRMPTGRLGEIEEITNLSCYLLSDYANWLTGEVINFDGGEFCYISGEFNVLAEMVSDSDWELFEKMIRGTKNSSS